MIELKPTSRGFNRGDFKDRYGHSCSIQMSSLATEACIWLGLNNPDLQDGRGMPSEGWKEFKLPEGVLGFSRMHLTQAHVKALLPLLQHFAETGELPEETQVSPSSLDNKKKDFMSQLENLDPQDQEAVIAEISKDVRSRILKRAG